MGDSLNEINRQADMTESVNAILLLPLIWCIVMKIKAAKSFYLKWMEITFNW